MRSFWMRSIMTTSAPSMAGSIRSKTWTPSCSPKGDERPGSGEAHPRAHRREAPDVRHRDAAVADVPHDGHFQALDPAPLFAHRVEVQDGLGRVLMAPIARVDHGGGDLPGQEVGSAAVGMTQHEDVRLHRQDVLRGVQEGLPLWSRTRTMR